MNSINTAKQFQPLEIGDWVVGFFMDGESGQFPIMMGYLPGFAAADTATSSPVTESSEEEESAT